jgi:transcriptional regulator with XRE-family HTH domain
MTHPVDLHVGARIRQRRWLLGITQQDLAERLGVSFQQVQKYESGANRVSASRLWMVAGLLNVPVEFFFEGLDAEGMDADPRPSAPDEDAADLPLDRDSLALLRSFSAIPEPQRRRLLDLARALSERED